MALRDEAELLWQRALKVAGTRRLLPADSAVLTPFEVARPVAKSGEPRLERLVIEYYYPSAFGNIAGPMSAEQAQRLIEDLEQHASTTVPGERRAFCCFDL